MAPRDCPTNPHHQESSPQQGQGSRGPGDPSGSVNRERGLPAGGEKARRALRCQVSPGVLGWGGENSMVDRKSEEGKTGLSQIEPGGKRDPLW